MINGYGQWAQQYRSRLWTGVLPLPPNAKSPVPKGYTGRGGKTPGDEQIEQWRRRWANGNIALRMPGDVLGIDVDDYPYEYWEEGEDGEPVLLRGVKTGAATLRALEAELGPLPATWRSSSRGDGPSGIRFFRVPPGLLWGDFGTHLEGIWWGHRYAVVYPSVNPDSGLQYLWINDAAERPRWGAEPPKITDLTELPESWTARFGRAADAPAAHTASAARRGATAPPAPTTGAGRGDRRAFTRREAADYVQPHLDTLRRAAVGEINDRLNDAAKVISHFVPAFWTPAAADALLWDALKATAYDAKTWKAEKTIASAFGSAAGDWVAELRDERAPRLSDRRTAAAVPGNESDTPPPPDDGMDTAIEEFWDRRPFLRHVHTYARSRYTAPWAVLGSTLALAVAAVEPNIQLPPAIGKEASLNLFVGLVGPSGSGKDIAFGVAEELLDIRFGQDPISTDVIPLGSGEGISHVYMKYPPKLTRRKKGDDEDSELIGLSANSDGPVQYRTRAMLTVSEIDTLDAQTRRQGSTVGGQLRQAWSGSQIGFHYADANKRMIVPKHAYRMCLVAGIQPGRAQMLLSGPESDGGTPQRFLWLPATDPEMTRDAPATPAPVVWQPPLYNGARVTFDVCPLASDTIVDAHIGRQRGDGDALDGHALLTRLKVAAALAMLDDRDPRAQCTVTDEDWELAGVIMAVSDRTREGVRRHLAEATRAENEKRAYAEAQKAIVVSETVGDAGLEKALRWARGKIGTEWITGRDLSRAVKSTIRDHLGAALDQMITAGEVESEDYANTKGGPGGVRYRRK